MLSKIAGITFLNTSAAGINFISNYFIVQWLGLEVFGEFAIYSSYVTLGTLVFSIIPANYSVFKFQDDPNFRPLLFSYFMLATILFGVYLVTLNLLGVLYINLISSLLYSIPLGLQNYFDISLQATNKLKLYFTSLLLIALLKILFLSIAFKIGFLTSFNHLVLISAISPILIIGYLLFKEFYWLIKNGQNTENLAGVIKHIKANIKIFSPYYLNTALKRIRESLLVILFNPFLSKEVIAIFALFVKIDQFVLGLGRNVEAFFMNRHNIINHKKDFNKYFWKFAFLLQIIYFIIGTSYMYMMSDKLYILIIFIQSIMVYPHIKFMLARAELLANYNNSEANYSELVYVIITVLIFTWSSIYSLYNLSTIVIAYIIAKFGLQIFLIFTNYKYRHVKNA